MSFSVVRNCVACGKGNRIPARHLSDTGRCGACKGSVPPQNEPLDVDAASFAEIVRDSTVPIVTDFWAAWCGPCQMAVPELKKLARETAGKALVLKINTEDHPQVAAQFGVQSIPYFLVLRRGRTVSQHVGLASRAEMLRWLEAAVS